uniref:Uncharacterized protein n=1 Tax=Photinus pyralis TaxID=7054 RepID=A0A1Y1LJY9_PHOPY
MIDGQEPEDVEITYDIPRHVLEQVLGSDRKRKTDVLKEQEVVILGDSAERLKQYCKYILDKTEDHAYRQELEKGTQWAIGNCLELNSALQHPDLIVKAMEKAGVKLGVALQLVNGRTVKEWWRIEKDIEHIECVEL